MKIEPIDIQNNADGQAIQIPEEFRIDDDKVFLKKSGNIIYIIPFHKPWENLLESLDEFTPDFMEIRDQPSPQFREQFD